MKTDIWMPLYIGDYLADTIGLTDTQHGRYLLTIMAYWRKRSPLTEDEARAVLKEDADSLRRFFQVEGKIWKHGRVDTELLKSNANREAAAAAGRASAAKRWKTGNLLANVTDVITPVTNAKENNGRGNGTVTECQRNCNPSPSPSPSRAIIQKEVGGSKGEAPLGRNGKTSNRASNPPWAQLKSCKALLDETKRELSKLTPPPEFVDPEGFKRVRAARVPLVERQSKLVKRIKELDLIIANFTA